MRTSDKVPVLVEPKCSECFVVVVNEDDEGDEGGSYLLSPAYPQAMPGLGDTMTHEVSWSQGLSSVSALMTGCEALLPHPLWSSPSEPDPKAQNQEPPRPTSAGIGLGWCWLLKALLPSGSCHQGVVLLGL